MLRLGRAKISDYVIKEFDKSNSKWLNSVLKCQCKTVMKSAGVFLRNKSSNGICGSSNKMGKDNMLPLRELLF